MSKPKLTAVAPQAPSTPSTAPAPKTQDTLTVRTGVKVGGGGIGPVSSHP
jgi:hypothetical protein